MTARTLATKVARLALEKKARDVLLLDLRKVTSTADFFVLCSADSDTQVKAIADSIMDGTERLGSKVWHSEGLQVLTWVVLDYVDVVVHVFHREARKFYNLERLWRDAKATEVSEPGKKALPATRPRKKTIRKPRKGPS